MTVPERIVEFLKEHKGQPYCDDCHTVDLALARRLQAQQTTKPLGATTGYEREMGKCSLCGNEKMVTAAK